MISRGWFGAVLLVLAASIAMPSQVSAGYKKQVSIHNISGMRLHVYAAGMSEVAQIAPGKWTHITLPVSYTYNGVRAQTFQLMIVGGGAWEADKSGWTTYRRMKTCTIRDLKGAPDSVSWEITGNAMKCSGPRGYRQ